MFFPHPSSRHRPSVLFSLKTLLVLIHRRIFRPNHLQLLGGSAVLPTTALLRLSHVLEHTSASKIDVRAKCFRLQTIRCILHAHRDYTRHTGTFRSDILNQHVLQLDSCVLNQMPLSRSGPTARLSMIVLRQRHCMHVTP